jgi:hypothetical protein
MNVNRNLILPKKTLSRRIIDKGERKPGHLTDGKVMTGTDRVLLPSIVG